VNAPKGWTNEHEIRARLRKVQRYVHIFDDVARKAGGDPTSRATAEEMVRQLEAATDAMWAQVAESMAEKSPASKETRSLVIEHYRTVVKRFDNAQHEVDELMEGLREERQAYLDGVIR
jgi:hypothetical protein